MWILFMFKHFNLNNITSEYASWFFDDHICRRLIWSMEIWGKMATQFRPIIHQFYPEIHQSSPENYPFFSPKVTKLDWPN